MVLQNMRFRGPSINRPGNLQLGYRRRKKFRPASKRYVRKQIMAYEKKNVEKKWLHTSFSQQVQSTGTTLQITSIPQGDSENQRSGRKVTVKSVHMRFSVTATASAFNSVRMIVFCWRGYPVGGTQPVVLDILESQSVQAHYAHKSSGQFQILYDKVFTVWPTDKPHIEQIVNIWGKRRGWNKEIEFDGNPASFTRHSNGLQLLMISDDNVTPYPLFEGIVHVTYTDS